MQISEQDFRDAIVGTKKDAKLVASAKNDRYFVESMYAEFAKLPVERQRDIIIGIANDWFVAANWKIAFPLNNAPAAVLPDFVKAAGKALFYTRDEDSVRETIRTLRLYLESPFAKAIANALAEGAEMTGVGLASVAQILSEPEIYGRVKTLQTDNPLSEKIVATIGRIATYTKDLSATADCAEFLVARRFSPVIEQICSLLESSIYLARDRKSVRQILLGFSAGALDIVLQKGNGNVSAIRDIAWKSRDWKTIRDLLQTAL
jgi:hypothetical protein